MTVQELAERFDVTPRTIYHYIQAGIIPRPIGRTRAARYTMIHVKALNAYREVVPRKGDRVTASCFAERRQAGRG